MPEPKAGRARGLAIGAAAVIALGAPYGIVGIGRGWGRLVKFVGMSDMNPQDEAYSPNGGRPDSDESVFDFPDDGNAPGNPQASQDELGDDGPYHGISFDDAALGMVSAHDGSDGAVPDGAAEDAGEWSGNAFLQMAQTGNPVIDSPAADGATGGVADETTDQSAAEANEGRLGEASAWIGAHLHKFHRQAEQGGADDAASAGNESAAVGGYPGVGDSRSDDSQPGLSDSSPVAGWAGSQAQEPSDARQESSLHDGPSQTALLTNAAQSAFPGSGMGYGGSFDFNTGKGTDAGEDGKATAPDSAYARAHTKHQDSKSRTASRRVAIMRGVITPIFGVIAAISLIFGILNSTLWRPQHDISASTPQVSTQYLATIPGVLQLVDDTVSVDVKAADPTAQLCMEVSNQNDVASWLDGVTYTQVSAMASWSALQTQAAKTGDADTSEGADTLSFQDSDLWTQATCGTGEIRADSLTYNPQDALIVVSDPANPGMSDSSASPYTLTLSWHRDSVPNYAMPFYAVALLFALLSVLAATVFSREHAGKRVAGEDEVPLWEQTAVMMRLRHKSYSTHRGDAQPVAADDTQTVSSVDVDDGKAVEIKDELGEITASYSVQDFRDYFNQLQSENPDLSASSVLDDVVATTGSMPAVANEKFRPEPRHADASGNDAESGEAPGELPEGQPMPEENAGEDASQSDAVQPDGNQPGDVRTEETATPREHDDEKGAQL